MNKTININIAGVVFQIDDDAFEKLRSYLQAVNNRFRHIPGGSEALEDFEARVAELFQGRKGITGIITIEDVNEVVSIMGRPEDMDDGYDEMITEEPRPATRRRLYRDPDETIISGVAGGIGSYLNFDPVWVRLLFILFTIFYGFGFFVYIALWIALPVANTESRKRELYGYRYNSRPGQAGKHDRYNTSAGISGNDPADRVGGALNEIFRALGSFFIILFRVIVIIIGTFFVLAGFAFLAMIIAALFFNYGPWLPGSMATESFYFSDFFPLIVNPTIIPWVIGLSLVVMALPLFALVYWGIKLIFRFRAKDGIISIVALTVWVMAAVALTMILFTEGISFADSGRLIERTELSVNDNTIYLVQDNYLRPSEYEKKIKAPFADYMWFYTTSSGSIHCSPGINIYGTESDKPYTEVRKYGHGPTRKMAVEMAGRLEYNYTFRNDSLLVDNFFSLPENTHWNGTRVSVNVYLPYGTRIFIDNGTGALIDQARTYGYNSGSPGYSSWNLGGKWWIMTENGLTLN